MYNIIKNTHGNFRWKIITTESVRLKNVTLMSLFFLSHWRFAFNKKNYIYTKESYFNIDIKLLCYLNVFTLWYHLPLKWCANMLCVIHILVDPYSRFFPLGWKKCKKKWNKNQFLSIFFSYINRKDKNDLIWIKNLP